MEKIKKKKTRKLIILLLMFLWLVLNYFIYRNYLYFILHYNLTHSNFLERKLVYFDNIVGFYYNLNEEYPKTQKQFENFLNQIDADEEIIDEINFVKKIIKKYGFKDTFINGKKSVIVYSYFLDMKDGQILNNFYYPENFKKNKIKTYLKYLYNNFIHSTNYDFILFVTNYNCNYEFKYLKKINEFDRNVLDSLIWSFNDGFKKKYFKNKYYSENEYKYYRASILAKKENDSFKFYINCRTYEDEWFCDTNDLKFNIFLDSLLVYYSKNQDFFRMIGGDRIKFSIKIKENMLYP